MTDALQSIGDLAMSQRMALSAKTPTLNLVAIDKAAHDFEGMFMSQMLQPMFEGLGVDPTFGGGHGEEIMRSLLVQEYGKMAAKTGRIGIADAVRKEMIRAQSSENGAPNLTSSSPGTVSGPSQSTRGRIINDAH